MFKQWLENKEKLPFCIVDEQGKHFETGKSVTFSYLRGLKKAPNFGVKYLQNIEPAGRYMIHNEDPGDSSEREVGIVVFNSPLVIKFNTANDYAYDETNWKMILYKQYKKKGRELSKAIRRDGYDGIITVSHNYTKEIVDISMF